MRLERVAKKTRKLGVRAPKTGRGIKTKSGLEKVSLGAWGSISAPVTGYEDLPEERLEV